MRLSLASAWVFCAACACSDPDPASQAAAPLEEDSREEAADSEPDAAPPPSGDGFSEAPCSHNDDCSNSRLCLSDDTSCGGGTCVATLDNCSETSCACISTDECPGGVCADLDGCLLCILP